MKHTFKEICRSLFVKDKQLFSFLLAITKLRTDENLDLELWNLMLTEKFDRIYFDRECFRETEVPVSNPISHIISDTIWRKIYEVDQTK